MDLTLRGGLAWRHAVGEVAPKATLAIAGSASLGISYAGQPAQDAQDHAFKANLAVRC